MIEWWPKVGDKLIMVKSQPSLEPHGKVGDIKTVVGIETYINLVEFDTCSCGRADGRGCRWSWKGSHMDKFELYLEVKPITSEEAANAKPLPNPDDVASFFGIRRTP